MRVFIDKSVCNKCHACIRVCSVGAVYYKNDRVYLNQEDCILCGKCMRVCKSNAIRVRCHAGRLEQLLSDRAVAVLDPVFCAAFDCKPGQLIAALREIGFAHVLEMTVGIEIYLNEWRKYMSEKGCEHPIISSYCPAVVSLVEKHFGNLSSFLLPVKSPMKLSSQFAKRRFPSSKVMFIGPCVARKTELKNGSYTDMVITFEELAKLFCKKKLNLKDKGVA